jgi:hypothetical protein
MAYGERDRCDSCRQEDEGHDLDEDEDNTEDAGEGPAEEE